MMPQLFVRRFPGPRSRAERSIGGHRAAPHEQRSRSSARSPDSWQSFCVTDLEAYAELRLLDDLSPFVGSNCRLFLAAFAPLASRMQRYASRCSACIRASGFSSAFRASTGRQPKRNRDDYAAVCRFGAGPDVPIFGCHRWRRASAVVREWNSGWQPGQWHGR